MRIVRSLFVGLSLLVALQAAVGQANIVKPGFVIAGVAVDERTGQPLANATISIASVNEREDALSAVTGRDGAFRFERLAAGKYSLTGKRRGYPPQAFEQHENYSSAIAVGENQDATKLVFRMHPDASIRGKIVDESNEAVPNIEVRLFETMNDLGTRSTRMVRQTNSDDTGQYSFGHLEPGTYYVMAVGRPWYSGSSRHMGTIMRLQNQGAEVKADPEHEQLIASEHAKLNLAYPLTLFDNVQDSTQASGIDLAPGDRFTADFRLTTVPAATLHFSVPAMEQPPAGEAENVEPRRMARFYRGRQIQLYIRMFDGQMVHVNSGINQDERGGYISGIAPGRYVIKADGEDGHASLQDVVISGDMDLPKVTAGNGATVKGKFVWDGQPSRGFAIMLTNTRNLRNYYMQPGENGEFEASESVLPGKYELAAGSAGGDVYVKSVEIGGNVTTGSKVEISEASDVTMTVTLARGTGTIDGIALLDDKPKAGAMVVLVPAEGWVGTVRFRRDQSDSDGTFLLRNVIPGKYKVVALRDGWKLPWSDAKTMQGFLREGTPVQISAGEKQKITVKVK
jgi:Carboxypeptidase regulatory-like domain